MTTWGDHGFAQVTAAEIDAEPPATAADWLAVEPEDRHPGGFEPRQYVTEISVPASDDGRQALYSPGLSEHEPEAGP
jgi:hypothetical protein